MEPRLLSEAEPEARLTVAMPFGALGHRPALARRDRHLSAHAPVLTQRTPMARFSGPGSCLRLQAPCGLAKGKQASLDIAA